MGIQLNSPNDCPFDQIQFVGLAITRGTPFLHVGFLYRNDENEIRLSDLAFHFQFRGGETPDDRYFWLEPQFDEMIQEQIAAYLMHIAEKNSDGKIPYSVLIDAVTIDNAKIVVGAVGSGLTCATYILKVFEALSIPLVSLQTWPVGRPDDINFCESILRALGKYASQEHIDVQRKHLPDVVRYRPEEIGAAFALFEGVALDFEDIKKPSEDLLGRLP